MSFGLRRGNQEIFQEESVAQGEVFLLGIEILREPQKVDTNSQSLAQWLNTTGIPTHDDLQASSPYLRVQRAVPLVRPRRQPHANLQRRILA